jgi:hypothetical protein
VTREVRDAPEFGVSTSEHAGADVEQSGGAKADAGRRYRAYPTPEQAGRLTGWGHSCRAVWNLALAQRDHLTAIAA